MQDCVEHFEEGRNSWKLGIIGFFTRIRGLAVMIITTFLTMGLPWWWPSEEFPKEITINIRIPILLFTLLIGSLSVIGFYYLRDRSKRSLDIKFYLHNLTHHLRDHYIKLNKERKKVNPTTRLNNDFLYAFIEEICNNIKNYLEKLFYDDSLEVAIRIAVKNDQKEIVYKTLGRSRGLNNNRAKSSEDIAITEGIPSFFRKKDSQGILRYNNLKKAAELQAFKLTMNEKKFPDEIVTMLVAPLNSWDGNSKNMIGLLHITSRKENSFKIKHIDSIKFVADMISPFISITTNLINRLINI